MMNLKIVNISTGIKKQNYILKEMDVYSIQLYYECH